VSVTHFQINRHKPTGQKARQIANVRASWGAGKVTVMIRAPSNLEDQEKARLHLIIYNFCENCDRGQADDIQA
jgi:hypothetical protein